MTNGNKLTSSITEEGGGRGRKPRWLWLFAPVMLLLVVVAYNWIAVFHPAQSALSKDYRNKSAQVAVYQRWGVLPSEIVFDIRSVEGTVSRADITRMLFQVAEAFEDKEFDWVVLAYKGKAKFKIPGEHFQEIGREFSYQNPVYLMRKLPQNVCELDGSAAFASYSGGWLGVLGAEMDDLNELHDRWWLDDAVY